MKQGRPWVHAEFLGWCGATHPALLADEPCRCWSATAYSSDKPAYFTAGLHIWTPSHFPLSATWGRGGWQFQFCTPRECSLLTGPADRNLGRSALLSGLVGLYSVSNELLLQRTCFTELYIPWSELNRRKLSPTLATAHYSWPDNAIGLIAQCELSRFVKFGLGFGGSWVEIFTTQT